MLTRDVSSDSYVILFLVPPRPPRPTLFPYTTLFRSHRRFVLIGVDPSRARHRVEPRVAPAAAIGLALLAHAHVSSEQDRKSTRLNSSHMSISYAVFCLKKKKY